jgi:hypothetical protein
MSTDVPAPFFLSYSNILYPLKFLTQITFPIDIQVSFIFLHFLKLLTFSYIIQDFFIYLIFLSCLSFYRYKSILYLLKFL